MGKPKRSLEDGKRINYVTTGGAGYVPLTSQRTVDKVISKVDNAIFKGSKAIMDYMSGFDGTDKDKRGESLVSIAQDTYLTPRRIQRKKFLDLGYKEVPGDYGLVRKAVGNRNIPVYQRNPDAITRDKLNVIGNTYLWEGSADDELNHAGSFPTAVYHDAEGNLYQKGWDLNDYSGPGGAYDIYSIGDKILANIADFVGSPTVVTTGYRPMYREKRGKVSKQTLAEPSIAMEKMVDNYLKNKGLERNIAVGNDGNLMYYISLPEVVVTGKRKKYKEGGIHIAPSKRGTFTAAATKHGMGVQEFASKVLRNKDNYSPAMVKKANFARNASKWNH